MNKIKSFVLIATALIAALIFVAIMTARVSGGETQHSTCPAGSYDIGISKDGSPICKLEPTGCPYGDSIPMDMCDKFAPQLEQAIEPIDVEPIAPAEPVECGGK